MPAHLRPLRQVLGRVQRHRPVPAQRLTIVTEFIGIALALDYLGIAKTLVIVPPRCWSSGPRQHRLFRRFERFAMLLASAACC
jgi:hypothetical protein